MDQIGAPSITDWLMVGITFVYMLFTIGIFIANIWSSKSAKNQLEETKKQMEESKIQFEKQISEMRAQLNESKRQFKETNRLSCLLFLQIETPNVTPPNYSFYLDLPLYTEESDSDSSVILLIKNVGNGSATNITYSWDYEGIPDYICEPLPINAIMQSDTYYVEFAFSYTEKNPTKKAVLKWQYEDLLGYTYKQRVIFHFSCGHFSHCENDPPKYLGKVLYSAKKSTGVNNA